MDDIEKVEKVNTMISIDPKPIPEPIPNLNKRKSSKNIFRVALLMMRGRSKKSKVPPADDESRSVWKKLVGSMRPMHLQSNRSPTQIDNEQNQKMEIIENSSNNDNIQSEDGFDSVSEFPNSPSPNLPSPSMGSSRYASAVGLSEMVNSPSTESSQSGSAVGLSERVNSQSQLYVSAVGLSEMVEEEEEEEKENKENKKEKDNEGNVDGDDMIEAKAVGGDEMIDAKADEFIAQFYQQMKLQRMNIVDHHYKKISKRSLGL